MNVDVKCQLCTTVCKTTYVDGRTERGTWADMCFDCHHAQGGKLGLGYGQKYSRQPDGTWKKVAG